ncbi:hypothetical protein D3C78_1604550 [compost metagenome]
MKKQNRHEDGELGKGSLFATGLVAGGAVAGVLIAFGQVLFEEQLKAISWQASLENALGSGGYQLLGTVLFAFMGFVLYRVAMKKE